MRPPRDTADWHCRLASRGVALVLGCGEAPDTPSREMECDGGWRDQGGKAFPEFGSVPAPQQYGGKSPILLGKELSFIALHPCLASRPPVGRKAARAGPQITSSWTRASHTHQQAVTISPAQLTRVTRAAMTPLWLPLKFSAASRGFPGLERGLPSGSRCRTWPGLLELGTQRLLWAGSGGWAFPEHGASHVAWRWHHCQAGQEDRP